MVIPWIGDRRSQVPDDALTPGFVPTTNSTLAPEKGW